MAGETVAARMKSAGYTAGFDYLRIGLAFAVVAWHSVVASGSVQARAIALGPVLGPIQALILPMFFALSGFLVASSIERSKTVAGFVTLRVLRIMPALAVEVLLSALILGPAVTTLRIGDYVSSHAFHIYFLNMIGSIHFKLPGVFEHNPGFQRGVVNLSLWTVPFELECYLVLVAAMLIGLLRQPKTMATLVAAALVVWWLALLWKNGIDYHGKLDGHVLVLGFLVGNLGYLFRDKLVLSGWFAIAAFVASFALLSYSPLRPLCVIPATYLTIWLGLQTPRKIMGGDYSYGVYLFAFPLQQVFAMFPAVASWWAIFLLTIPLSLMYAAFSWHCVEKPILSRKRAIVDFVEVSATTLQSYIGTKIKALRVKSADA